MKFIPTIDGYQSTNWTREISREWNHINYIASTGDHLLQHWDSWALWNEQQAILIFDWCAENIQDDWAYSGGEFYFKNKNDALLFALRWLGQ